MKVLLSEKLLSEIKIKNIERERLGQGEYSNVFPVGKNKVGKQVKNYAYREDIVNIYKIMKLYPNIFGKIKITGDGHVIQDKMDVDAAKRELKLIKDFIRFEVSKYRSVGMDDIINDIILNRIDPIMIYNIAKEISKYENLFKIFNKYLYLAYDLKEIYKKHQKDFRYKFPDVKEDNIGLDSNGKPFVIDFINPFGWDFSLTGNNIKRHYSSY